MSDSSGSGFEEVLYEVDGPIATLTLNLPEKLNPMSVTIVAETVRALGMANEDRFIRVVIITGAGRALFCRWGHPAAWCGSGSGPRLAHPV